MNLSTQATMTIDAELRAKTATAQMVRFEIAAPGDHLMQEEDSFLLDLCLTPRPPETRACYPNRWRSNRFERLGDLFFLPPGEVMHVRCEGGDQTSLRCRIDPELISTWFDGEVEWTEGRLEAGLDVRDESIHCMLMRVMREVHHPGFASEALLELIASQLAIELGRYCKAVKQSSRKRGLAAWQLRAIDERVRETGKAPALSELAKLCELSIRQLSRGFRVSRGCSIGQYVEQHRIESAKRMLVKGNSVKAVAYSMGFSTPSSFSFAFRRATGICPAQFRQLGHKAPGRQQSNSGTLSAV